MPAICTLLVPTESSNNDDNNKNSGRNPRSRPYILSVSLKNDDRYLDVELLMLMYSCDWKMLILTGFSWLRT